MTKMQKIITTLTLALLVVPFTVSASTFDTVNSGINETGQTAGFPQADEQYTEEFFTPTLLRYVRGITILLGLIFMAIMIYGGFLWMSARGNEAQVEKAKQLLVAALIGFGIALGSRIIVEFILLNLPNPVRLQ